MKMSPCQESVFTLYDFFFLTSSHCKIQTLRVRSFMKTLPSVWITSAPLYSVYLF